MASFVPVDSSDATLCEDFNKNPDDSPPAVSGGLVMVVCPVAEGEEIAVVVVEGLTPGCGAGSDAVDTWVLMGDDIGVA